MPDSHTFRIVSLKPSPIPQNLYFHTIADRLGISSKEPIHKSKTSLAHLSALIQNGTERSGTIEGDQQPEHRQEAPIEEKLLRIMARHNEKMDNEYETIRNVLTYNPQLSSIDTGESISKAIKNQTLAISAKQRRKGRELFLKNKILLAQDFHQFVNKQEQLQEKRRFSLTSDAMEQKRDEDLIRLRITRPERTPSPSSPPPHFRKDSLELFSATTNFSSEQKVHKPMRLSFRERIDHKIMQKTFKKIEHFEWSKLDSSFNLGCRRVMLG